jgi:hypothetical protein
MTDADVQLERGETVDDVRAMRRRPQQGPLFAAAVGVGDALRSRLVLDDGLEDAPRDDRADEKDEDLDRPLPRLEQQRRQRVRRRRGQQPKLPRSLAKRLMGVVPCVRTSGWSSKASEAELKGVAACRD